jgi:predicted O-methyltransferase YrrM
MIWDSDLSPYGAGSTEPWAVSVLQALVRLKRPARILELGTFEGRTTHALAEAAPKAYITTVDLEARFAGGFPNNVAFCEDDAIAFLKRWDGPPFNFVFVDDDHTRNHVATEIALLHSRGIVASGGLIVGHDVEGAFDLGSLFVERGGFIISLPRLHAAGSLGVLEVP